ncbi:MULTISPECIES: hypothetical protein [Polymorphospora]|uniref:Uncharacterized protein n=1 Tax=Polymorphospora lycopeni TaxID=3140240 RepID=A0ABV5D1Q2_9ACTN
MLIDCQSCTVRGAACRECVVTALLDTPREISELTADDRQALEILARAGLDPQVITDRPATPAPAGPVRLAPPTRRRTRPRRVA